MIESFYIKNFRLFKELEIERFGRVNLIVGQNNCGKSALLEAIRIYASNAAFDVLEDILISRQEFFSTPYSRRIDVKFSNSLRHLFFGHSLPKPGKEGIVLGLLASEKDRFHIGITAYKREIEDGSMVLKPINELELVGNIPYDYSYLTKSENGIEQPIVEIEGMRTPRFKNVSEENTFKYPCKIVPTKNIGDYELSNLWDAVNLTDLEQNVVSGLQLIYSKVTRIAFKNSSEIRRERIPVAKLSDAEEPYPLKNMGDGMSRILQIMLTLVNSKDGILLIDEFENGLYWGVQPKVWEIVFMLAKKLNVQVFATTHSRDCIEAFQKIWSANPDDGAFIRLTAKQENVKVTAYDLEDLTDAIASHTEVR